MTGQPVFQLTPDEAMMLANSISEVSKHYNLDLVTGPTAALLGLAATCGMIYLPRIVLIRTQRAAERAKVVESAAPSDADNFGGVGPVEFPAGFPMN